jgi:hypothetical protein
VLGKRSTDTTSSLLPPTAPSSSVQHKAEHMKSCVPLSHPSQTHWLQMRRFSAAPVQSPPPRERRRSHLAPENGARCGIRHCGRTVCPSHVTLIVHLARAVIAADCSARRILSRGHSYVVPSYGSTTRVCSVSVNASDAVIGVSVRPCPHAHARLSSPRSWLRCQILTSWQTAPYDDTRGRVVER